MLELAVFAIGLGSTLGISFPFSPQDYRRECRDMFPEALRVHSQLTNSPYKITTSDTFYEGVSHEKVTLQSTGEHKINAFFLQARVADCSADDRHVPLGHFEKENGHEDVELVHCSGKRNSAVTSRKWNINKDLIVVRWIKPSNETRKLFFRATIVSSEKLFWMENFSANIRSLSENSPGQMCPFRLLFKSGGSTLASAHVLSGVVMIIAKLLQAWLS